VWRLIGYDSEPARMNSLSTFYIGVDGGLVADDGCTVIGAHIDTKKRPARTRWTGSPLLRLHRLRR
jgi:hypothetical protein